MKTKKIYSNNFLIPHNLLMIDGGRGKFEIQLPEGCVGIQMFFDSLESLKEFNKSEVFSEVNPDFEYQVHEIPDTGGE